MVIPPVPNNTPESVMVLPPVSNVTGPFEPVRFMFNDDVQMGFFDVYDQYLLNILYDPRVRPGMTREEVSALLPEVMPTARTWVDDINLPRHADARHQPVASD